MQIYQQEADLIHNGHAKCIYQSRSKNAFLKVCYATERESVMEKWTACQNENRTLGRTVGSIIKTVLLDSKSARQYILSPQLPLLSSLINTPITSDFFS